MQGITLLVPDSIRPDALTGAVEGRWNCSTRSPNDVLIEDGSRHLFLRSSDKELPDDWDEFEEFDNVERSKILSAIPHPRMIAVDYNDVDLVREFIMLVADRSDFMVATDFGDLMKGTQFADRLRANPQWDWAK